MTTDLFAPPPDEFEAFWKAYPRRVAKLDAAKAFQKARKIASFAEIMAGVERYAAVPRDAQFTAHPATWLNQGRWMDEPESPPKITSKTSNAAMRDRLRQEIENGEVEGYGGAGDFVSGPGRLLPYRTH